MRFQPTLKILTLLLLALLMNCETVQRAEEVKRPTRANIGTDYSEVPSMLRGTIKQHVALMGYSSTYKDSYEPVIASGYGLVVGLKGTGSSDIPPQVRAHMIADLARRGIGESTRGWGDVTPEQLINSEDTAVVIIEAVIPQAATGRKPSRGNLRPDHPSLRGTLFDARVRAEPSSATTSLEGGYLLPSLLRTGQLTTGRSQTREIAFVSGDVFLNPFANPGSVGSDAVHRTSGRILKGGEVLHNLPMRLVLLEPSHTRSSLIQNAINRVFPEEFGQDGPTARGISDEQIEIRVPPSWKDDVPTFMEIMNHITIRSQQPESVAMSVKRLLITDPSPKNADAASWRWRALGDRILPVLRDLYDSPEDLPRNAALKAGGRLKDPIAIPFLLEETKQGNSLGARIEAIHLLKDMPQDPRIMFGLRPLLDSSDVEIRLQTAEALIERRDPAVQSFVIDDKFDLLWLPSSHELVYVTQSGEPRIIMTGDVNIQTPLSLNTWNNNLLVKESADDESTVDVRYHNEDSGQTSHHKITTSLPNFTMFLAHHSTPEEPAPGLDLSYSRTIGAIHELWRQEYLNADFKVEQDRLLAVIQRLTNDMTFTPRPDFVTEDEETLPPPTFLEVPTPEELGISDPEA